MKKQTATEAFIAKKANIDELLARIQEASDDHFGATPEAIDWGHVGSLGLVLEHLTQITNHIFNEGEE